jgi:cyclophilin family peptidyl-prolyl cis-trans isomerase
MHGNRVLKTLWVMVALLVASVSFAKPKAAKGGATPPAGGKMMIIETQYGTVEIEFYPNDAPKTVARISELVGNGFYNGLAFHRVVPGFVVQGGDPKGDGTGGSGQKLPAEFNSHKHVEGTVSMARTMDPNSADSQFYISLGIHPHLDNQYTVFGKVIKGMDAVKKIKVGDKMTKVTLK